MQQCSVISKKLFYVEHSLKVQFNKIKKSNLSK